MSSTKVLQTLGLHPWTGCRARLLLKTIGTSLLDYKLGWQRGPQLVYSCYLLHTPLGFLWRMDGCQAMHQTLDASCIHHAPARQKPSDSALSCAPNILGDCAWFVSLVLEHFSWWDLLPACCWNGLDSLLFLKKATLKLCRCGDITCWQTDPSNLTLRSSGRTWLPRPTMSF